MLCVARSRLFGCLIHGVNLCTRFGMSVSERRRSSVDHDRFIRCVHLSSDLPSCICHMLIIVGSYCAASNIICALHHLFGYSFEDTLFDLV